MSRDPLIDIALRSFNGLIDELNAEGFLLNNLYQEPDGTFRVNFAMPGRLGYAYGHGNTVAEAFEEGLANAEKARRKSACVGPRHRGRPPRKRERPRL